MKNKTHKAWQEDAKAELEPKPECKHQYEAEDGPHPMAKVVGFNFCPWCGKNLRKEIANGETWEA